MLWGALNNSSTAMMAMSTDLGAISQNVANVNTTGYKRTETMFKTMMSEHQSSPNTYTSGLNIFGVQAVQRNHIEAQGVIQASSTWSDLAINGKGFFMLGTPSSGATSSTVDTANPDSVLYTRDGSWHRVTGEDTNPNLARSYFAGTSGGYLLGWMADETGAIDTKAKLEPVYTLAPKPIPNNGTAAVDNSSTLTPSSQIMQGRATTAASILANIPRDVAVTPNTYTSTFTVNDPNGVAQTLSMNWARSTTDPSQWNVTYSIPNASVTSGTYALTSGAMTVTMDGSGNMIAPVTDPTQDPNTDTSVAPTVVIDWDDATYGAAAASTTQTAGVSSGPKMATEKIPMQVFDSNFKEHTVNLNLERTGTNSWNLWTLADANETGTMNLVDPVSLTFDGNGQLITPSTGTIDLSLNWDDGTTASTADLTVDLNKLSQYAGSSTYVGHVTTDGYGSGTLMATTFNDTGELEGYYSNGHTRTLFKVPVANFVSENALDPVSGNLFRRTKEAGDVTVSAIEDAPGEGRFATSSLETSTTDIEDEFTRMIMTQKAYSTNAQVFKTADEMTSTARDLKR